MMMFKRIHWLCIYAVVFLLFFIILFVDIKQKVTQITQQQTVEKNVLDAIEINKKVLLDMTFSQQKSLIKVDNKSLETSDILAYVTHFFVSQGMTIHKVQLLKIKTVSGINVLPVKVNAVGDFSVLTKLVAVISAGPRPVVINDFSLQIDRNGVMIVDMRLWVFAMYAKALKVTYQGPQTVNTDTLLHGVSLKKMKWVGFLRHEQAIWGLLMLPAGQTVQVQAGSIIGVEKGQVAEVKEDGVVIDLMKKKIKIGNSV